MTALMPCGIRTNLQRHVPDEEIERLRVAAGGAGLMWKTARLWEVSSRMRAG